MISRVVRRTVLAASAGLALLVAPSAANAALIIDFDQLVLDGGTLTPSGGGNAVGTDIIFTAIYLRDTSSSTTLAGVQCGSATSSGAATTANACQLDFNTATQSFVMTAPGGLYDIGPDGLPYSADRGGLVAANGAVVLSSSSFAWTLLSNFFLADGVDSKNADLLSFFGISATSFRFLNTEIYFGSGRNNVLEADLVNMIPEPGVLALFGVGLLGLGRRLMRRRAS